MPETILSIAKTTRPTLSQVLDRERLFSRLDACCLSRAIWISGPPGCGKSTLIASYAQARKLQSLWYQVDDSDNDIATFFHYLRRTVEKHSQLAGEAIPNLPSATADWSNYGRRFFRAMFSRFGNPLLVIFDNCETLPVNSGLHDLLAQAIGETPGRATLILTGRGNPPAAYARARTREELLCLNGEDLRFSLDECRQVAGLRQAPAGQAAIETIHAASDGWITGIVLLLEQNRRTGGTDSAQLAATDATLTDYLAGEIFNGFDAELRDFLLKVCWPQRLGMELAVKLSGTDRARQYLHNLASNNYFVSVGDDDSGKLEYSIAPLLRDFLRRRARQEYRAASLREIQRRAAELLMGENQSEAALDLLLDNLDWEAAEPLLARLAPILHQQGRNTILAGWLDALPQDRLSHNCGLLYWYAKTQMRTNPRTARQYFERAFQHCETTAAQGPALLLDCCGGAIAAILAEADDYSLLDRWIETLVRLGPLQSASSAMANDVHPVILLLSAMMIRRPDHPEIDHFTQTLDEQNRFAYSGDNHAPGSLFYLSLIFLLSGRLESARECLSPLLRTAGNQILDPALTCQAWMLLGLIQLFQGEDSACSAFGQSREIAIDHGMEDSLTYIDLCDCAANLMAGATQTAEEILSKLKSRAPAGNRLVRLLHHYLSSWRLLLEDAAIEACHEQQRCLQCALELGMPFLEVMSRTALAQLLFICGDERNGSVQLRRVHAIARDIRNPLLEFMTLLVYGGIAVRGGKSGSGGNALRYALSLGRNHAFYHLPWWHGTHLAGLCATALREGIETDYVRNLIRRRKLPPPCPSAELPEWPWPLRVHALGEFTVMRGEGPVRVTDKLRGRPQELLGILLALGGRDISAQEIAALMWPRVDEDYAFKSFTINLHRLRKILGDDEAILLREGKLCLNPALVWTDIWTLESVAKKIASWQQRSIKSGNRQQLTMLMKRLLDCYQGSFRVGDPGSPVYIQAVQRYERHFAASIARLDELLRGYGDDEAITRLYQQAQERSPESPGLNAHLPRPA